MSQRPEPLDVPRPLGVERRQVRPGEVERDRDGDRPERHPPLRREVEARAHPADAGRRELPLELGDDRLQGRPRDRQAEIADRAFPEVGFLEGVGLGVHGRDHPKWSAKLVPPVWNLRAVSLVGLGRREETMMKKTAV